MEFSYKVFIKISMLSIIFLVSDNLLIASNTPPPSGDAKSDTPSGSPTKEASRAPSPESNGNSNSDSEKNSRSGAASISESAKTSADSKLYSDSENSKTSADSKAASDSDADETQDKSSVESSEFVDLKVYNGVKYIFKSGKWVEAYSGLIDGNWKELENGNVLEAVTKAKNERRLQGLRSPFLDFWRFEGKNYGLDRAKKEWIEVDNYSFPLENGKRIPYNNETLIK